MRVLVLAASTMAQAGLAALVESAPGLDVAASVTAAEAARVAEQFDPDVCLLDLEGSDDVEVIVSSLVNSLRCPLVTVSEATGFPVALRAGAVGALTPAVTAAALAAALEAARSGVGVVYPADALLPPRDPEEAQENPAAAGRVEPLTSREMEVLRLLAQGLTNQQLALELGISGHTAKFHVGAVLAKLGAQSRAEAVALGYRLGLVAV